MAMSDQSRMILAAVLMMAVLVVSWMLASPGRNTGAGADPVTVQEISPAQERPPETPVEEAQPPAAGVEPRNITVLIMSGDTVMVDAGISTLGGAVTRWRLEGYPDFAGVPGEAVNLAENPWLAVEGVEGTLPVFASESPDTVVVDGESEVVLTAGSARRVYTFREGSYSFDIREEGLSGVIGVQPGVLPVTEEGADMRQYFNAYWYTNKMVKKKSSDVEALGGTGNSRWVAVASRYFTIILLPGNRERAEGFVAPGEGGSPGVSLETSSATVYAGPVSYTVLSELGSGTEKMVDFGFPVIRQLAQLIFLYLNRVLSFMDNWGLRIIVLAVTLKLLMMPLTKKSFVAMQKMQKLSPAIKEIQQKYAADPQKQQQAMQKLYKESGANPLGGCLPMLLQMPVFFAMYRVLANAVELRGAPFVLWITDLSRPEILIPFQSPILGLHGIGLLALVTGAFMIIQQRMSSASMQQQKGMMYLMSVFMSYIFMKFAAGLNLYWMVYNLLTMGHQELIKKKLEAE
jgi:YidC/Oxa1 family membrane protein insertase